MSILRSEVTALVEARLVTPVGIKIKVVSVVGPLVESRVDHIITLDNPDYLLGRVVKVELNLDIGVDCGLVTCELKLLNQVLVSNLGEAATLISVEVDVVNEKCH